MKIREAEKGDADFVAWTVLTALDMPTDDLSDAISACGDDYGIYSWKNAIIAEEKGKAIGCLISYPGDNYIAMREYTWPRLWKEIDPELIRNTPHETERGEYYLDSMAILPEARGKGLGKSLMQAGINRGKKMGYNRFGLIVDIHKSHLHDYYKEVGFEDEGPIRFFDHLFTKMTRQDRREA